MDEPCAPLADEDATMRCTEVRMNPHMETQTVKIPRDTAPPMTCVHGRIIDDVLTKTGKRTGRVCCLECGAIFDDPYQGNK